MKNIILSIVTLFIIGFGSIQISAYSTQEPSTDPLFMEDVYSFITSPDLGDGDELNYCEQVYLEVNRRRDYTEGEMTECGEYIHQKNREEQAYMYYMYYNREYMYGE
ncbi:MAG: hypothetical protein GY828_01600 [Candidatus Gracilibacteria bacterium]|nr:hypothetical protein [Candidatus Gracilibacteria bacterium]